MFIVYDCAETMEAICAEVKLQMLELIPGIGTWQGKNPPTMLFILGPGRSTKVQCCFVTMFTI